MLFQKSQLGINLQNKRLFTYKTIDALMITVQQNLTRPHAMTKVMFNFEKWFYYYLYCITIIHLT
jgi:hypothetical protein